MAAQADELWLNAQYSVLGAVLIDEKLVGKVLFELSPDDFGEPHCRALFERLDSMFADGVPIDIFTIAEAMGGDAYIPFMKQLMDVTPTTANIDHHIRIVRERSRLHALRDIGEQLRYADDPAEAERIMEQANSIMVRGSRNRGRSMADLLVDFGRRMENPVEHLQWPIAGMENLVRVRRGHYIMICAEPSTGKTAFALQCATGWAKERRVGFFSLEMGDEDITDRIVTRAAKINYDSIQDHKLGFDEYDAYNRVADALSARKLKVYEASGYTVQDIKAVTMADKLDVVIIDYAQLITGKGNSEYEVQTGVSKALHNLALSTKTVVVALAQVTRSGLASDKLTIHDIKGTGQWEQDADVILLMSLMEKGNKFAPRYLETGKNRNGRAGYAYLNFIGPTQTFTKMQESAAKQWLADRKADKKAEKEGVYKNERFC